MVFFEGKTVRYMPEHFKLVCIPYKCSASPLKRKLATAYKVTLHNINRHLISRVMHFMHSTKGNF